MKMTIEQLNAAMKETYSVNKTVEEAKQSELQQIESFFNSILGPTDDL